MIRQAAARLNVQLGTMAESTEDGRGARRPEASPAPSIRRERVSRTPLPCSLRTKDWMECHTYILPRDDMGRMVNEGRARLASGHGMPPATHHSYDFLPGFECAAPMSRRSTWCARPGAT